MKAWWTLGILLLLGTWAYADGPADNLADKVRRVPPLGVKIPEHESANLAETVDRLGQKIADLRKSLSAKPALLELLPDVEIFHNAVHYALKYNEFYKETEVKAAHNLIKLGMERANQLAKGDAPWLKATGGVVRGYRSKIDDSVQPYGLLVPASYQPGLAKQHRLDFWFHGRGEVLTELSFLNGRLGGASEFAPPHAFVLHPYGRYCNANHFAGEIDTLEALEHAQKYYPIDPNRVVVRGFSMGGAACWNFAVHYADRWAAAHPGAGFSESPDFLRVFQKENVQPTEYEKKLFHLYDCTDWALNLFHCPTVAYSGEIDSQKQAGDIMAKAVAEEGMKLTHIIGPKTGHSHHPQAKIEINRRIDAIVAKGRNPMPRQIRFTTWTLRYPKMYWVTVQGLEKHWERARVEADIPTSNSVKVTTKNVTALTLDMASGLCPFDITKPINVTIDGQKLTGAIAETDRSWTSHFVKSAEGWKRVDALETKGLRKQPGLTGPIDDAFMDRFVMVEPTEAALNSKVGDWVAGEYLHALDHWRRQFRGELKPKKDTQITDADIANSNLILWGDPNSNKILAKIANQLPIRWSANGVEVNGKSYPSATHVPALIYPNPLNPKKYVVVNSSFTFREYDYLNNARQIPKLPDWAIYDVTQPPTSRHAAKVEQAGFFDEGWKLR